MVHIRPARGWIGLDWRELWRYRELFGFLVWRDIKIKYKQTALGAAWAILVPFLQMVVFTVIFGRLAGLSTDGLPPSIFYFAGLIPWTYFATATTMSSNALVGNQAMVTKIYFPRIMIPTSPCLSGLLDLIIAFAILLLMMLVMGVPPAATAVFLPLLIVIALATALGTGLTLSALNVKFRDVKYVVPFLIQMWMYLTVIIPFSALPASLGPWRWLYGLNPMAGVVEGFRWCLLHPRMTATGVAETVYPLGAPLPDPLPEGANLVWRQLESGAWQTVVEVPVAGAVPFPWPLLVIGGLVAAGLLSFGAFYFRKLERQFADVV